MDAFMYAVDPYRRHASAGYYAPRHPPPHPLDRRASLGLSYADPYARFPLDSIAGYAASAPVFETDLVIHPPRYASRRTPFRSRPPPPAQKSNTSQRSLGPRKKPFKQAPKVRFSEEKATASKKPSVKKSGKAEAKAPPAPSQSNSLVQETKDLHVLFRTGVDSIAGKKGSVKSANVNGSAKKRKAESKKQKGNKKKKPAKQEKAKPEKKVVPPPTKEQLEEAEASLDMQRGFCKSVCECLGLPLAAEAEQADPESKPEVGTKTEKDVMDTKTEGNLIEEKSEEPQRTPEEEKEVEASSLKLFAGLFADHPELRDSYIDKCNAGSFECLVCYSANPTRSKTFWNVVSLVMHAKMTKRLQPEHSGYGRAISAVLGWDHEKIPKVPGARPWKAVALVGDESNREIAEPLVVTKVQLEVELTAEEHKEETLSENADE